MDEIISKMVESQFQAAWNKVPSPPKIKFQNVNFIQPINGEWITLTILGGSVTRSSLGPVWVEKKLGVVLFQTFTQKNSGNRRAKQINDLIGNIFRGQQWGYDAEGNFISTAGAITTKPTGATPAVFTMNFRDPEEVPTPAKTDYFQLNYKIPFVASIVIENG